MNKNFMRGAFQGGSSLIALLEILLAAGQAGVIERAREPVANPTAVEAAASRPAGSKAYGVKARSEKGRKNKSERQAARRKERAHGETRAPDKISP